MVRPSPACGGGLGVGAPSAMGFAERAPTRLASLGTLPRKREREDAKTTHASSRRKDARPHSRGAMRPRFASTLPFENVEGAGKAGCRLHPWVPCNKKHGGRTTGSTGNIRLSLRDGFTAYFVLSPVTGLSCHRRFAESLPRNLAPASGRQDHTTSPSAGSYVRLAQRRVHRIPPRVHDDSRSAPRLGET